MHELRQRIEQLEIKAAYQEDTVNQLNAIIIEQQQTMERLKLIIAALQSAMKTQSLQLQSPTTTEHEPPPHY